MGLLSQQFQSLVWHIITGKFEVCTNGNLRKRKHSELQPSGCEWIGNIPKTWKKWRLKDVAKVKLGSFNSSDLDNLGPYPFYRATKINPVGTHSDFSFDHPDYLIFVKDGGSPNSKEQTQVGMGEIFRVQGKIAATSHNLAIIPTGNVSVDWLTLYFKGCKPWINDQAVYTTGLGVISQFTILNLIIPTPDAQESIRIINILEQVVAQNQSAQQRLTSALTLAEQQFQSLVWHVVTGKYEVMENGELRKRLSNTIQPSKIPWAGSIPAQWSTIQFKNLLSLKCGFAFDATQFSIDDGIRLIRQGDVENTETELKFKGQIKPQAPWVQTGDLLITLSGDYKAVPWKGGSGLLNQRVAKVESALPSVIIQALLDNTLSYLKNIVIKTTIDNLAPKAVVDARVPNIPTCEVRLICAFLQKARKSYEQQIQKLQELL